MSQEVVLPLRVAAIHQETLDIRRILFVPIDGGSMAAFDAGAHIDVETGPGMVRQYSLCNGPGDWLFYEIAVKLEDVSRGGSRAMHALTVGDEVQARGPRNHFALDRTEQHFVLLAGGIGVTPLLSMARHLHAEQRSFEFHYFVRSDDHVAFAAELRSGSFVRSVSIHAGQDGAGTCAELDRIVASIGVETGVYICGPRPFIDAAHGRAAAKLGETAVHVEYFAADEAALSKPQDSFSIKVASTGQEMTIPVGRSILDVLAEAGVHVDMMCEQGVCGTCITGVLEGVPDHRDSYLTDGEKRDNKMMMVCCSRAKSLLLVLDL